MVRTRTKVLLAAGALFVLVGAIALPKFLPERSKTFSDAAPSDGQIVLMGSWSGRAGHSASGTVSIVKSGDGFLVRFEDFAMTDGPAVYLYVSTSDEPDSHDEIQSSWKLRIEGGADGGELTKRGDFNQALPAGFDVSKVKGLGAWCEDFRVPFAVAAMNAPA